jgi:hypothetical protein
MGAFDKFRNWLLEPVLQRELYQNIITAKDYYQGVHKRPLKVKTYDDNLTVNFCGLIVDRSVSDMVGGGVKFTDLDDQKLEYLKAVWDINKQEILLHRAALSAGIAGTGYIKIIPEGITDWQGRTLPRLVNVDPAWCSIETDPEDAEMVQRYVIEYTFKRDGKDFQRKEETKLDGSSWTIDRYIAKNGGKYTLEETIPWEYAFPPILHWQNLPALGVYGDADVTPDVIELQDKYNFVAANIGKIIRFHAHPKTIVIGASKVQATQTAPDEAMFLPTGADAKNLEMQSDLASSMGFLREVRQSMFDITRTVDIDSIQDKIGALTNFGLRVLYKDALSKIDSKQELFGDMLIELNRRLLVIGGMDGSEAGHVKFANMLPDNEPEEVQTLKFDLEAGLVSKETASQVRGYEYDTEQPLIQADKASTDNIGNLLLQNFNKGL